MSRALVATQSRDLYHEVEIALRSHRVATVELIEELRTLAMLVRLASELIDTERTLVLVSTGLLLSRGLESLLKADDLFRGAAAHIVPIILVEAEHAAEQASMVRMTGFSRFVHPPLEALEISRQLAPLLGGGQAHRQEPAAPSGSLFATSARMVMSQTHVASVDEPRRDASKRRVTTELPSLRRSGSVELTPLRLAYTLYMQGVSGLLRLELGEQRLEVAVRGSAAGRQRGARPVARDQLVSALASPLTRASFVPGGVDAGGFERVGGLLGLIFDATQRQEPRAVSQRFAERRAHFPTFTDLLGQRQRELARHEGLLEFCHAYSGQEPWSALLKRLRIDPERAERWALYAEETDLLIFSAAATEAPLTVRYLGLETAQAHAVPEAGSSALHPQRSKPDADRGAELVEELEQRLRKLKASDPYAIFGLKQGCGVDAVREAFRGIIKEHHPDVYGGNIDLQAKRLIESIFIEYKEVNQRLTRQERNPKPVSLPPSAPPFDMTPQTAPPVEPPRRPSAPPPRASGGTRRPPWATSSNAATIPPGASSGAAPSGASATYPPRSRPRPASDTARASAGDVTRPPWLNTPPEREAKTPRPPAEVKPEDALAEGERLMRANQTAQAVEAFQRAVAERPDDPRRQAWLRWSLYLADKATDEVTARELEALTQSYPSSLEAWLLRGKLSKLRHKLEEAHACFQQVLSLDPSHAEALREVRLHSLRPEPQPAEGAKDKKEAPRSFFGRLFSPKDKG